MTFKLGSVEIDPERIADTKRPVAHARHLPGVLYTSPEVFEHEKEKIFMQDWLCVGRVEEIENPGDYMAIRVLSEPVLVARDDEGAVKAYANICAHRGVEVAQGSGNLATFTCPYHGWTYGLDGKLIGAPHMKETEAFDAEGCGLPAIACGVWKGWIFITFNENPRPLADHVAPLERDFGYLRQEDCRLAIKTVSELDCNWKLVVENLIDFYHLDVVHSATNGRTFTADAFKFTPRERGGYTATYNSGPSTPSGEPVFGPMPWMTDKPGDFATGGLLTPNFTMFARIDDVHPTITWPIAPDKTRVVVYTLLPKVFFDQPDFEERVKAYQQFQSQIMNEDREMLDSLQNGLGSRRFRPGHMSYIERGVHHILNAYVERALGPG